MVGLAKFEPLGVQQLISPTYGVPLRDLLRLEGMQGTTVLAGHGGLDRMVLGINVMEVPDIADWVKPHDLLVTTGFPLASGEDHRRRTVALTRLIRDLHARELTGLGVKLGRYVDSVDPEVLALADELDFPLLGLPMALAFDDLLRQAYGRIHELTAGVLERIDALHRALTLLVLEGGDLDQIAAEVARVLDLGVLITSTDGRLRASALPEQLRTRLEQADLLEPGGRFRVERASTRPAPVGDGEVRLQPIVAGGTDLARLVCFSPHRPLSRDDVVAMERAATVAALLVTRQEAVAAVENKYRGDFLRDVFLGRAGDRTYVTEHAASLGWDLASPMYVVSAELDPMAADEPPVSGRVRRSWQERFATAWRQVCEGRRPVIPTVDFTAEVVALVPDGDPGPDGSTPVDQLVAAVQGDRGGGRRPFSVGVSRLVTSPDQLPEAYLQARRATEVGRRVSGGGGTTRFDSLGVHRLIALVPDPAEARAFAVDVLGELAGDTEEAADLRSTLQTLLDHNLNVAEAARQLFFHYNTMRYRVNKLERLLGPFTSDPHLRLDIAVALQVLQLRG
ncbi:Purine catabolism regulatory protein [Nocardioides dokdonensis FR1436]|uniref:Purine catabolism regulatory protein n=1 Tax=Nocardioides dokdonensis FR1436 TaxID=1300347 RepID=A0A1A9GHI0_9ACTN|nr:PucR family transcriptional regulator [Nocardioides dokdonensis]ANH37748.1 Purine catabolism regulatory protein [Nocardioides dokdonensis FR1436]